MAHNPAEQKHIDELKKMSTAQVIARLCESLIVSSNRFKLDISELEARFKEYEKLIK